MSVVGFDLGNLNSYIAVARQGGIEVITNDYSLHATPSCVSFGRQNRTMGVAARQQVNTNVKNTLLNFKQLVGRKYSDPVAQKFIPYVPCEVVQLPDDYIGFKVDYLGEKHVFTPEQVVAMLLVKLRDTTQAGLQDQRVSDIVLAVPSYFTDTQRRCLLNAVEISGLNCLRILNETTAVALAYGIYKQDLPGEKEAPRIVAFVDVGHSAAQASIVAFNKGRLAVVGSTYDLEVGGMAFDAVLRDHFRIVFKDTYKIDAGTNTRAWIRLLDGCEKLKKQMSANSTAIPLNIECLMNDKDVTSSMQRADFEELAQPLFERIRVMLQNLLQECGMQASQINEVEIVGGSSRIPAIKKVVAEVFGQDTKTTMNQDEAVARGAAMECAILSPSFRVREFSVKDSQPYRIKLSWGAAGGRQQDGENDVFKEHDEFPYSKMITLHRQEPFQLSAVYSLPNTVPHASTRIGEWKVSGVKPGANNDTSKVKVKVRVNPNGVFSVHSATMFETVECKEEEEKQPAEQMETNGAAKTEQKEEEEKKEEKEEPMEKEPEEPAQPKTKTIATDLPIEEHTPQLPNVAALKEIEQSLQAQDRREKEKVDAKNAVEEYVYYMRDKISDSFAEFITQKDAESYQSMLTATEDWLYDEGEDAEKKVYEDKLSELKKIGEPVQERHREHEHRKGAFDNLDRAIIRARKAYDEYAKGSEKYAHIESKDMEKVISAIEEKKKWVDEQRGRQERHPKTDPPVVFVAQIMQEQDKFENIVNPVLNKPKPKPPKKETKKDAKNTTKEGKTEGEAPSKDEATTAASSQSGDGKAKPAIPDDMEVD